MKMYVIFVKTGRENAVFRELKKHGFDAILPLKTGKVIFENYVFLRCDMSDKLCEKIMKFRDINCVLGWNDKNCIPFLKKSEQNYIEYLWNRGKSTSLGTKS